MLLKRITLFKFFGFDVKADVSWLILAVLISWTFSTRIFPHSAPGYSEEIYQWMGIAGLAGVIISILAHEVAHAIIAEYYQMPIKSITLFIFGGVAEMKGEPSHAKGEFFMAISGPLMSAFMALLFWGSSQFHLDIAGIETDPISETLKSLSTLNLIIVGFNMIPAFPLDGGRALRAALWCYKGNLVLATRIASEAGAILAYGLMAYGLFQVIQNDFVSGMWSGLMGLFIAGSGESAVKHTEAQSLLSEETVSRFIQTNMVSVSPDLLIVELVDNYIYKHYQRNFPVVDQGQLVGTISLQSILELDRNKWAWLPISRIMAPVTPDCLISPEMSADKALDIMQRTNRNHLMVTDGHKLIGVLYLSDLTNYLAINTSLNKDHALSMSR